MLNYTEAPMLWIMFIVCIGALTFYCVNTLLLILKDTDVKPEFVETNSKVFKSTDTVVTHIMPNSTPTIADFKLEEEALNMPSPNVHIKGRKRGKSTKKYDTAKFTVDIFDTVMEYHDAWKGCNEGIAATNDAYVTKHTLTSLLNTNLNLNKSQSAYARIWNGIDKREDMHPNATLI